MRKVVAFLLTLIFVSIIITSSAEKNWTFDKCILVYGPFQFLIPENYILLEENSTEDTIGFLEDDRESGIVFFPLCNNDPQRYESFVENEKEFIDSYSLISSINEVDNDQQLSELVKLNNNGYSCSYVSMSGPLEEGGSVVSIYMGIFLHKKSSSALFLIAFDYTDSGLIAKGTFTNLLENVLGISASEMGENTWICPECNNIASGNFCKNCGAAKPETNVVWICPNCGNESDGNFCSNCGVGKPSSSNSGGKQSSLASGENKAETKTDSIDPAVSSLIDYAKQLAEVIGYSVNVPASGSTETVSLNGKTYQVHSDFKYALDVYYEFYKEYFDCLSSMKFTKMLTLAEKVEELDAVLKKIDDLDLTEGDMAYYLDVYARIMQLIAKMG